MRVVTCLPLILKLEAGVAIHRPAILRCTHEVSSVFIVRNNSHFDQREPAEFHHNRYHQDVKSVGCRSVSLCNIGAFCLLTAWHISITVMWCKETPHDTHERCECFISCETTTSATPIPLSVHTHTIQTSMAKALQIRTPQTHTRCTLRRLLTMQAMFQCLPEELVCK